MKEWIKDIVIAIIIALVVVQFIKPTIVKESSMEPNFYENDYLFVSKQAYRFNEPKRGDVVIFHSSLLQENGDEKLLIKRVIGLPGEIIEVKDGHVYINGKMLDDSFTMDGTTYGYVDGLIIPPDKYFCMGDNRDVSIDSRDESVGCVDIEQIVGKAVFRLFPFGEFGTIDNPFEE